MENNKYVVNWTETAQNDLLRIIDYISEESISKAKNIFDKISIKTNDLEFFPQKGKVVSELKYHNIYHFREIPVSPWRIFYTIENMNVFIMAVIDGRRNVEDILLNRFLGN